MTDGVAQGVRLLAGRYQVGELIGHGGMADVHVGKDSRLGRRVAIKLLRPELATDPAFRTRFRREAQDAAKMAHPTIVRIFDAGEEIVVEPDGSETQLPFIIMEYVDGRLLKDMIATGPITPAQAVDIVAQVLTALEYSHRAGLVHRDIKPGNIMITTTGQVKVMDFGIARAITDTSATIAETSTIVGTAQYFSPEQARGEAVDARTDLYSTGIVLFELLTGRAPFVGENPVAVAYQHVNQQAVAPSAINPRVTPALDAVVLRAISKDRFERFQSATDFRRDVEAAGAGAAAPRRTAPVGDFNSTLFGVNPTATAGSEATIRQLSADQNDRVSRSQARPPVAWIWGGIAIMAVIIVAVMYWTLHLTGATDITRNVAIQVPTISGKTWEDGSGILMQDKLVPDRFEESSETIPAGTIVRTVPEAGVNLAPDDHVKVFVSSGVQQIAIPKVANLSRSKARETLVDAGFKVGKTTRTHSPTVKENIVIGTTPSSDQTAVAGSTIDLLVSDGEIKVPRVVGKTIAEATSVLGGAEYQLVIAQQADLSCEGGKVLSQSIQGDHAQHSKITLVYCGGGQPNNNDEGDG